MKNILKKILCVSIALLMLLPVLVACKKDTPNNEGTSDSDVVSTTEGDGIEYDENGYQKDKLGTRDYGGRDIRILAFKGASVEEFIPDYDSINNSVVGRELYLRDMNVEDRLKVNLVYNRVDGNNAKYKTDYLPMADSMISGNEVDAFACYSMCATPLMTRGYLVNMLDYEDIDVTAPWWSKHLIERATIYDKLYFATGSIAPSFLGEGVAVFFNKTMADAYLNNGVLDAYDAETLYDMVENKTWTIDNFMTLSKTVTMQGVDKTDDDTYGYNASWASFDAWFFASGLVTLDNAADGSLQVSESWNSEKTIGLLDKLLPFVKSNSVYAAADNAWKKGDTLFTTCNLVYLPEQKNNHPVGESGIGVLPMPMWDSEQGEYLSTAGFPFTVWGMAKTSDRLDAVAATLECLASEGYRTTEPAFYETVLKIKSVEGEGFLHDVEMIDLVRDSIVIDAGRVHNNDIGDLGWGMFRSCLAQDAANGASNTTYSSYFSNNLSTLQGSLDTLNLVVKNLK